VKGALQAQTEDIKHRVLEYKCYWILFGLCRHLLKTGLC